MIIDTQLSDALQFLQETYFVIAYNRLGNQFRAHLVEGGITLAPDSHWRERVPKLYIVQTDDVVKHVQVTITSSANKPYLRAVIWFEEHQGLIEIVKKCSEVYAVMLKAEDVACQNPNAPHAEILSQAGVRLSDITPVSPAEKQ